MIPLNHYLRNLITGKMCLNPSNVIIHFTIVQLTGYLNDPLLEQVPQLETLQRYLHHLSLMQPPPTKRELILEQVKHTHMHVYIVLCLNQTFHMRLLHVLT